MKQVLALGLLLFLGVSSTAMARNTLSCTSFGSFETFELTPPQIAGPLQGQNYSMRLVDMAQMEPQQLILNGRINGTSFDVMAKQPSFRTGQIEMGRMIGKYIKPGTWEMIWYPVKSALNGEKVLKFTCENN